MYQQNVLNSEILPVQWKYVTTLDRESVELTTDADTCELLDPVILNVLYSSMQ